MKDRSTQSTFGILTNF